jgi:hypothetical protein
VTTSSIICANVSPPSRNPPIARWWWNKLW